MRAGFVSEIIENDDNEFYITVADEEGDELVAFIFNTEEQAKSAKAHMQAILELAAAVVPMADEDEDEE